MKEPFFMVELKRYLRTHTRVEIVKGALCILVTLFVLWVMLCVFITIGGN
jgi:hypothetical protein